MLENEIIEPSISPWRAQVVVVKQNSKERVVIWSNGQLDAYPLPHMEDLASEIAKYKYFTTIDLKSAYHEIPIHSEDCHFTAFEANSMTLLAPLSS